MTVYKPTPNKYDGESQDTCPTCGGRAETKATTDASGHTYRLTCRSCPWSVPLSEPPTATTDDAVLVTDGGTRAAGTNDGGPQTAQDILDELHSDESVARVAEHIQTGDADPTPTDVLRTFALAEDRLCLTVAFRTGTEYIWLADGWTSFVALKARPNGDVLGPITLTTDELAYRLSKPIGVELVGETDVARPNGGDSP